MAAAFFLDLRFVTVSLACLTISRTAFSLLERPSAAAVASRRLLVFFFLDKEVGEVGMDMYCLARSSTLSLSTCSDRRGWSTTSHVGATAAAGLSDDVEARGVSGRERERSRSGWRRLMDSGMTRFFFSRGLELEEVAGEGESGRPSMPEARDEAGRARRLGLGGRRGRPGAREGVEGRLDLDADLDVAAEQVGVEEVEAVARRLEARLARRSKGRRRRRSGGDDGDVGGGGIGRAADAAGAGGEDEVAHDGHAARVGVGRWPPVPERRRRRLIPGRRRRRGGAGAGEPMVSGASLHGNKLPLTDLLVSSPLSCRSIRLWLLYLLR